MTWLIHFYALIILVSFILSIILFLLEDDKLLRASGSCIDASLKSYLLS
jgi:hypothetical protein